MNPLLLHIITKVSEEFSPVIHHLIISQGEEIRGAVFALTGSG
jgi:hypothetical protein